ncbi:MAG: GAF domain-containing protein [Anaerolineae bacterium]
MRPQRVYDSLRFKITAGVVIPLLLSMVFFTYFQYVRQRNLLMDSMKRSSTNLGEVIEGSLRYAMLSGDLSETRQIMDDIATQRGVKNLVLLDKRGEIRISSQEEEVGTRLDRQDPTCQICHQEEPQDRSRSVVFTTQRGERVFRNVNPIANAEECHACHDPATRINGVLITDLSMAEIDAQLAADVRQNILLSLVGILLAALGVNFAMNRLVLKKLEEFMVPIKRFSQGDFTPRVRVGGRDEIGELAESFNRMAQGLEEKARLERQVQERTVALQRQTERLSALHRITATTIRSLDLAQILDRGLAEVLEVMDMEAGEIYLLEDGGERLKLRAYVGSPTDFVQEETTIGVGQCLCGQASHLAETIVVQDVYNDPRATRLACQRQGYHSVACVPLRAKDRALGVLTVHDRPPRHFGPYDVELLTAIGNQLGIAIENAQLYEGMERRVQELSQEVQNLAVLEERDRIGREMHDGLAQALGYLNLKLKVAQGHLAAGRLAQAQEDLEQIEEVISESYDDVREAITNLRTTVSRERGLIPTLREYVHEFGLRHGLQTELVVRDGDVEPHFAPADEIQLIRIVQEALANVRKHAQAQRALVAFKLDGNQTEIVIQDDGRGFDADTVARKGGRHFGLAIMRERAESLGGALSIESQPGKGTRVIVRVPRGQEGEEG